MEVDAQSDSEAHERESAVITNGAANDLENSMMDVNASECPPAPHEPSLGSALDASVGSALYTSVGSALDASVGSALDTSVGSALEASLSTSDGVKDPSFTGHLTDEMMEEKKELDAVLQKELQEEEERKKTLLSAATEDDAKQKYNQLEFLLQKSTLYTDYLLQRMKSQQEDQKRKSEKRAKRAQKLKEATLQDDKQKGEDKCPRTFELGNVIAVSVPGRSEGRQPKWWPGVICKHPETAMVTKIISSADSTSLPSQPATVIHATFVRFFGTLSPDFVPDSQIELFKDVLKRKDGDKKSWASWEKNRSWAEHVRQATICVNAPIREKMKLVGDVTYKKDNKTNKALKQTQEEADKEAAEKATGQDDVGVMAYNVDVGKKTGKGKIEVKVEVPSSSKYHLLPKIENTADIISGYAQDTFSRKVKEETVSDLQPQLFTGGVLRDYQIAGFVWMKSLFENGINGILADEMGLGKTVQCIGLVADLISKNCKGPFLVVAPLSTIPNWFSEFKRFTPLIPVMVHHGHRPTRVEQSRKIGNFYNAGPWTSAPVVLTSYEMIIWDRKVIGAYPWKCLIVDEGHRIKNMECRLIKELKLFNASNRLLLTGTPLQNNLKELWSLLNFLLPEIFDDLTSFESWFDMSLVYEAGKQAADSVAAVKASEAKIVRAEKENKVLSMLHKILEPFLLRRLKSDVQLDIPPKREVMVYAPLTDVQEEFYKSSVDKTILSLVKDKDKEEDDEPAAKRRCKVDLNYGFFDAGEKNAQKMALIKGNEPQVGTLKNAKKRKMGYADESSDDEDDKENLAEEDVGDWYDQIARMTEERERNLRELKGTGTKTSLVRLQMRNIMMLLRRVCNHPFMIDYPMDEMTRPTSKIVNLCGKMMILDQMLVTLKKRGHKVLIFSQMTQMLDIIADYLDFRGFNHSRLDGSMKMEDRQVNINAFNDDPDRFVFLLSTRAGGLGLNLMAADTVIIYDSDWNPQCDLQAQDRAHRIGQTRPVMVYRLVTANTIDQRIVERAAAKRKLEKMVIKKGRFHRASTEQDKAKTGSGISPHELLELLQSRDQDMEMRSTSSKLAAGDVKWALEEDQLDRLLDRSELYVKWELDRKRRKMKEEGREEEEIVNLLKLETEENGEIVKSEMEMANGNPGNAFFSVVDTTSGVTTEDLV